MSPRQLHYVHDPLCGWCYAASPLVEAVADALSVRLHGGGLWPRPTALEREKSQYIRLNDLRITSLTGLPFGSAYLTGLLSDSGLVLWSRPTIAAVMAAGLLHPGADLEMLHALQVAHYVQGRRIVETDVLVELAQQIGLAASPFAERLASVAVDDHIAATRRFMHSFKLQGFPAFLVEVGGRFRRLQHESFYGDPSGFAQEVDRTVLSMRDGA